MPVLRELVSRFSFETDKKSVKKFDSTIAGMKGSLKGLAGVFGLALGGKALFDMSVSAKAAEADLKRVSGVDFKAVEDSIESVRLKLEETQKGAGLIVSGKVGQVAAFNFIKQFDPAVAKLGEFEKLLKASAVQSLLTRESLGDVFTGFLRAKTGDLSIFGGFAGIDEAKLRLMQDLADIAAAEVPGGAPKRAVFTEATLNALLSSETERQRRFEAADPALTSLRVTKEFARVKAEKFTLKGFEEGAKALTGAADAASDILKSINTIDRVGIPEGQTGRVENLFGAFTESGRERLRERLTGGDTKVEINTTIHVQSPVNEKEVVEIYKKNISKDIKDASNQVIRGEQR